MKTIAELKEERSVALNAAKALNDLAKAEDRDLSESETATVTEHLDKADELEAEIKARENAEKIQARIDAGVGSLVAPAAQVITPDAIVPAAVAPSVQTVPASALRFGTNVRSFTGSQQEKQLKAYKFGMFVCAANGNAKAKEYCADQGLPVTSILNTNERDLAVTTEGNNTSAGFLVADEFEADLIRLVEEYGICRRYMRQSPMISDTKSRPRRTGGLTAYHVGENEAGTESDIAADRVNLVAKKIMALTTMSNEINEDSAISIGDLLMEEISLSFALREDQDGFNGTGLSASGGIVGVRSRLTDATAGLITGASGTNTNWAGVTLANFNSMVGLVSTVAKEFRWYCSNSFWGSTMQRVAQAAGGTSATEIIDGVTKKMFQGYEVITTEVMPKAAGTAEIICCFGDLRSAATFGDRRGMAVSFSTQGVVGGVSLFENDLIGVKGTERFDVVVHDVGDTSNAGPLVGLLTSA